MHRTTLDFSGIRLCLESPSEIAVTEKLKPFLSTENENSVNVTVSFSPSLENITEHWTQSGKQWHCLKNSPQEGQELPYAHVGYGESDVALIMHENYRDVTDAAMILRTVDLNHILLQSDAFVLHAAYIVYNGEAILFTAPSGTGKSTQAELWEKYRGAEIINGDRCLIRKNGDTFTAGGIYYSGTSQYCGNETAPIKAIVLLKQAKENTVRQCRGTDAFRRIFRECAYKTDTAEDTAAAAQLVADLTESICIAELACLPDETAVTALERFLNGRTVC